MDRFLLWILLGLMLAGCGDEPAPVNSLASTSRPLDLLKTEDFVKASSQQPSGVPPKMNTVTSCQIDWVNDRSAKSPVRIEDKSKVGLVGWAADLVKEVPPQDVFIVLYGPVRVYVKAITGLERMDVASAHKKLTIKQCGWEVYANLSDLPPGTYFVQIIQVNGREASSCDTQRTIILK